MRGREVVFLRKTGPLLVGLAVLVGDACALSAPQFEVVRWVPDSQGFGCPLEMVDRESAAKLQLRLSEAVTAAPVGGGAVPPGQETVGYYVVTPEGALGVGPGQWLRVDCRTRQSLGVVKAGA